MSSRTSDYILIGGNQVGLERDVQPIWLPDGAYPLLENAFVFREQVVRKRSWDFFGRLRRVITSTILNQTTTAGTVTTIADLLADANIALRATEPDAEIEPGSVTVSVADGNPSTWDDTTTPGVMTATGGNAADGTINYVTGAIVLNFVAPDAGGNAISVAFTYYPTLPCMGIRTKDNPFTVNQEETIGFDTKYAYTISSGVWIELPSTAATTWQGNNSQFFWTTNYFLTTAANQVLYFFASNFNYNSGTPANSDPIRYYNDNTPTWAALTPQVDGTPNYLLIAKIILPYKGRLIVMNTVEGTATNFGGTNYQYPQRLRFSASNQDPTTGANTWRDDIPGNGGYIDAPTGEAIVGAEFIKDNLVVYFERSSWLVDYTGDKSTPFVFRRINSELGAEGTFSTQAFDEYAVGVGDKGLHVCNGYNTKRFDTQIPNEIFKFQNSGNGPERLYSGRDYYNELVYFTYPQEDAFDPNNDNSVFPNRVLVYNYQNSSWAKFTESFTCYGYFQRSSSITWGSADITWGEASIQWAGELEGAFIPRLMAGNQQGFTLIQDDRPTNEKTLAIQDLSGSTVTCKDHNLRQNDYILIEDSIGVTAPSNVLQVQSVTDADNFIVNTTFTGTYLGGGVITVFQNFRIGTKRLNPYLKIRNTVRLSEIDFLLDTTDNGEFEAQLLIDENTTIPMPTFSPFDPARRALLPANRQGNIVLTRPETGMTFQPDQEKIWHSKKYSVDAQVLQVSMTLTDAQMQNINIYRSDFVLHAILFRITPSGRLVL